MGIHRRPRMKARVEAKRAEKVAFEQSFSYEDDKRAAEAKASAQPAARVQQTTDEAKREKRR